MSDRPPIDVTQLAPEALLLAFDAAAEGTRFVYHVGDLARDRHDPAVRARAGLFLRQVVRGSGQSERRSQAGLAADGRCRLHTMRQGDGFAYVAVKVEPLAAAARALAQTMAATMPLGGSGVAGPAAVVTSAAAMALPSGGRIEVSTVRAVAGADSGAVVRRYTLGVTR